MEKKIYDVRVLTGLVMLFSAAITLSGCKNKQQPAAEVKEPVAREEKRGSVQVDSVPAEEKKSNAVKGGNVVKNGNVVKVQYTGTFNDGTVFDKSTEGNSLQFTVGAGEMIPGFEKAVMGMKLNENKKVTIKAEDAYGKKNSDLIRKYPRESVPANIKPEVGMKVTLRSPDGSPVPATITEVNEKEVTIDLNHPLADRDLTFEIKVVSIE